jgi:hypothetical protein
VRIEAGGIAGAEKLSAALRRLGVRIVDDGSAGLIVVLASDYLDQRLAQLNRQWLAEKQDWLPVQLRNFSAGRASLSSAKAPAGLPRRSHGIAPADQGVPGAQLLKQAQCVAAAPLPRPRSGTAHRRSRRSRSPRRSPAVLPRTCRTTS